MKSVQPYVELLARYVKPHWILVLALMLLLLGATALQLVAPQMIRHFIDTAAEGGRVSTLYSVAGLFLAINVLRLLLDGGAHYLGTDLAWRATNGLRADVADHVVGLDMSFHNAHRPGDLLERIDGDVEALSTFFSRFAVRLLTGALLAVGLTAVIFVEDWRFGLIIAVWVFLFSFGSPKLLGIAAPFWRREAEARADLFGFIGERLSGVTDIQKLGAAGNVRSRFRGVTLTRFKAVVAALVVSALAWGASHSLGSLRLAAALLLGAYLFQRGEISIGTVFLMYYYSAMAGMPLAFILFDLNDLQRARAGVARTYELLARKTRIEDGIGAGLPDGPLSVAFDNVSFSYSAGTPVLRGVTFRLSPGETLGLLGRTGSGKTTVSRLLFRFYDPSHGSVRLGGVDIRDTGVAEVRRRLGLVTQEVQIFHASLRDNVTLFDSSISDDAIVDALGGLELGGWFESLPHGLDTEIDPGGLSAGEAQILAFTRVFLRDPDVVVFDEASSRLDLATEALIGGAVRRLLEGRTAVVIAHRLATVQRLDRIVIMEEGRVAEHGERKALAADAASTFSRLLRAGLEEVTT